MRPITPEKQLILEDLFKGGGQDSSSLKGTRETFSRFWDIVGLVPVFSLGSDYIWIFCFSLSWSLGLVFCPTLYSCCLQGVSLHHGSHLPSLLHELSHTHSHSILLSLSRPPSLLRVFIVKLGINLTEKDKSEGFKRLTTRIRAHRFVPPRPINFFEIFFQFSGFTPTGDGNHMVLVYFQISFTTKQVRLFYLGTNGLKQETVLGAPQISQVILDS
jgi:hypothetical protein